MSTPEARRASVMAHRVHRRRMRLEAAVEAALALLDALDADCELEDSFDREPDADGEPELGSQENGPGGTTWNMVSERVLDGEEGPGPDVRAAQRRMGTRRRVYSWGCRLDLASAEPRPASELLDADETAGPDALRAEWGMGGQP